MKISEIIVETAQENQELMDLARKLAPIVADVYKTKVYPQLPKKYEDIKPFELLVGKISSLVDSSKYSEATRVMAETTDLYIHYGMISIRNSSFYSSVNKAIYITIVHVGSNYLESVIAHEMQHAIDKWDKSRTQERDIKTRNLVYSPLRFPKSFVDKKNITDWDSFINTAYELGEPDFTDFVINDITDQKSKTDFIDQLLNQPMIGLRHYFKNPQGKAYKKYRNDIIRFYNINDRQKYTSYLSSQLEINARFQQALFSLDQELKGYSNLDSATLMDMLNRAFYQFEIYNEKYYPNYDRVIPAANYNRLIQRAMNWIRQYHPEKLKQPGTVSGEPLAQKIRTTARGISRQLGIPALKRKINYLFPKN